MGKLNQFITTVACSYGSLLLGLLNVWPSYTLSLYTNQNDTLLSAPMSEFEGSLLGSLPSLGGMLGCGLAGVLMNGVGRKKAMLVMILPYTISWAIIEVSSFSIPILIARFMAGVSGGFYLVANPIFISEISDDSIRGMLASAPMIFYCTGILISYILGWLLSYQIIIWINIAMSIVGIMLLSIVCESPLYLLKMEQEKEAVKALCHYRDGSPTSKIILDELSRLKQLVTPPMEMVPVTADSEEKAAENEKLNKDGTVEEPERLSTFKLLYKSISTRNAFIVVGFTLSLQTFMGMVAVQVYAKDLFSQAAPSLSSHFCSVLFAIVLLGGSLFTAAVADKAGRRVLIISSAVLVGVCMTCLGYLLQNKVEPPWLTALLLLVYCFSFNYGAGTIPYVLLAEVFIPEVQSLASMILVEWVWFLNFVIIAIFPLMAKIIGIHGLFYCFAAVGVCNAVLSFFMVPETKGLSLEQIQEAFLRRKRK